MQRVGNGALICPRCGTAHRVVDNDIVDTIVPALVERCRKFQALCILGYSNPAECWEPLGIAEAINKPEARPQ